MLFSRCVKRTFYLKESVYSYIEYINKERGYKQLFFQKYEKLHVENIIEKYKKLNTFHN